MACLIAAEAAIFIIFVVAYIFYIGKSLNGPTPRQVLELPIFNTDLPAFKQPHRAFRRTGIWPQANAASAHCGWRRRSCWARSFCGGTAMEWYNLIVHDGLTLQTNLFGTTFIRWSDCMQPMW